jgi:hypothetical protein
MGICFFASFRYPSKRSSEGSNPEAVAYSRAVITLPSTVSIFGLSSSSTAETFD